MARVHWVMLRNAGNAGNAGNAAGCSGITTCSSAEQGKAVPGLSSAPGAAAVFGISAAVKGVHLTEMHS